MSASASLRPRLSSDRPLTIAILAMGGQGGGVLADWIVSLAEAQGWAAQSTSVPGVAQRTGATIYYIEMLPERDGKRPIFALMPAPGDVDIVLAAEWMEAGRSILRGLVTPDRTTVIASTHRAFAVQEKERPGNGIADSTVVTAAGDIAAKRIVVGDMQALAERSGTAISATLFGALAATGTLPFPRAAFEDAIRAGGKGTEPSLRGFGSAFAYVLDGGPPAEPVAPAPTQAVCPAAIADRIVRELPPSAHRHAFAGAARLFDYQDVSYAGEYLDHLRSLHALDRRSGGGAKDFALTVQAAKHLARAMSYDDVIRVADLKTRRSRFERVRREVAAKSDQIVHVTEFMHPRMEEILSLLPRSIGLTLEKRPGLVRSLDRVVARGRRVRTSGVMWFLGLYLVAGLGRFRRGSLRHARERAHIAHWLDLVATAAPLDYDLAVEALTCRRLVKGYSDTHTRGLSKFDRVVAEIPFLTGRPDAAGWLRRLKMSALAEEAQGDLDGALATMRSAYS